MNVKDEESEENENNILNIDNIEMIENNNLLNNNLLIQEDEDNEEERKSIDTFYTKDIKLEDIQVGTKIRCPFPNCFENCIVMIDPNFFEISFDCGKHSNKIDIIKYIKDSGISKEDKEQCFKCKLTYKKIKEDEDNKILYKCYCGKNLCKKCKKVHLDEYGENKKQHNMIDFKYKDYKCGCSNRNKKFNSFCFTCKKNLCQICDENHKDHEKKNFGELSNLTEDKKNMLYQEIEIQKKLIDKFKEIIDDWFKRVKIIINKYKKKLELYYKINLTIFNRYKPNINYFEEIKNTEYIRTDFDDNFYNLINSENDIKRQNSIICNILNDNMEVYINYFDLDTEKMFESIKIKDTNTLNGIVNHFCEIKKEESLIVSIHNINNNKDELYLFKQIKTENNLKKYVPQFSREEDFKILSLKELKSGYLLIVTEKQFKICEASKTSNTLNTIKEMKLEDQDERFKEIIELINSYLISISYSINVPKKNKVIFWKINLMKGNYEIYKKLEKEEKPIDILEINKEKFVILFENKNLCCYNSKSGEENILLTISNLNLFKKMVKVKEDGILLVYEKLLFLFSLSSLQIKYFTIDYKITDIMYISNSNNYYLASFTKENNHGFFLLNIDILKFRVFIFKKMIKNEAHSLKINCIYQLNNGDIITGSDDRKIKIWDTK